MGKEKEQKQKITNRIKQRENKKIAFCEIKKKIKIKRKFLINNFVIFKHIGRFKVYHKKKSYYKPPSIPLLPPYLFLFLYKYTHT